MKNTVWRPTGFGELFRHCIIVSCEPEAQGVTTDAIIKKVFNAVLVP